MLSKQPLLRVIKLCYLVLMSLLTPIALILRLVGIRVLATRYDAIGHLAPEPDLYLREQKLNGSRHSTILFAPFRLFDQNHFLRLNVSNRYLLRCWADHFWVIKNPLLHIFLFPILKSPLLKHDPSYYYAQKLSHLYRSGKDGISIYTAYEKKFGDPKGYTPLLRLKKDEIEKGKKFLKEMGLSETDWFVCFNCREAGYYSDFALHSLSVRNAEIDTFDLAIQEVLSRGGWCIRMGSSKSRPLSRAFQHERIIDYPHTKWVGEFMDIFLVSQCKFFIGTNSGLTSTAAVFGTPCILTNVIPFGQLSFYPKDLVIFKLQKDKRSQSLLKFSQCLSSFLSISITTKDYEELNIEVIDNTREEIKEVCCEMLARLEGNYRETSEETSLQSRFHGLMHSYCLSYKSLAKVGSHFLKTYESLLN